MFETLETLVDPVTRGDPESPLRWTSKSTRVLAAELTTRGYAVSPQKVGQLLAVSGYSLQGTQKTLEARRILIGTRSSSSSTIGSMLATAAARR